MAHKGFLARARLIVNAIDLRDLTFYEDEAPLYYLVIPLGWEIPKLPPADPTAGGPADLRLRPPATASRSL